MSKPTKDLNVEGRIVLSTEAVNSFGFRVLTAGIDLEPYIRNPVMLYMHHRGEVIGLMVDLRVEADGRTLTGVPRFDEASELDPRCKKQWEFGSLRMCSICFKVLQTDDSPELKADGQTQPTVTACTIMEVSLVDIGANPESIRLMGDDGQPFDLADGKQLRLALQARQESREPIINPQKTNEMEVKKLALALGLKENATEAEVEAAVVQLKSENDGNKQLCDEVETMRLAAIEVAVDGAIGEHRLTADKKQQFVSLGQQIGLDSLKQTLACMQPAVKLSDMIHTGQNDRLPEAGKQRWTRLSEVPPEYMAQLKAEQRDEYHRLYRAEYGMDFEE